MMNWSASRLVKIEIKGDIINTNMENNDQSEENKLIWDTLNEYQKQFKRIDKNTVILSILVVTALVLALFK